MTLSSNASPFHIITSGEESPGGRKSAICRPTLELGGSPCRSRVRTMGERAWVLYLIQICEAFHGRVYTIVWLFEFSDIACLFVYNRFTCRRFFFITLWKTSHNASHGGIHGRTSPHLSGAVSGLFGCLISRSLRHIVCLHLYFGSALDSLFAWPAL